MAQHFSVIHKRTYIYTCTVCKAEFSSLTDCNNHLTTIHGQQIFYCYLCGLDCATEGTQRNHMKLCAKSQPPGEPLKCVVCGEQSKIMNHLISHVMESTRRVLSLPAFCVRRSSFGPGRSAGMSSPATRHLTLDLCCEESSGIFLYFFQNLAKRRFDVESDIRKVF